MNNEQFRKLMLASSAKPKTSKDGPSPPSASSSGGEGSLGSRQRANIPMTPRSVSGAQSNVVRQLAERNGATHPQKRFKTSAPKGVKLASGYVDRTMERENKGIDNREERLKALEELYKKEEIDKETFGKLRLDIAGGELKSTHLVKGLDFKLLQRIRQGENIYESNTKDNAENEDHVEQEDPEAKLDDEFDNIEQQEIEAVEKKKSKEKKKGQLSTVPLAPGKKRTRDQILAELKASRAAAKAKQEPALGNHFRKIGAKQQAGSRIEMDSRGREVLIVVDEDGHEKRKVRKIQNGQADEEKSNLLMPSKDAKPLGMEVPEQYRKQEETGDDMNIDIFDDVGDDYDPLAGVKVSDSEDSDSDKDDEDKKRDKPEPSEVAEEGEIPEAISKEDVMPPPPKPTSTNRNYFHNSNTGLVSEEAIKTPSMSDPAIMAAIKRAAALNPISKQDGDDDDGDGKISQEKKAREERRKRMLEDSRRDEEDLDMGFGTSRFEDEEDFDDQNTKLSVWGNGGQEGSKGGKAKRKRGPKKRKGNANDANDVLRVMEQRKK